MWIASQGTPFNVVQFQADNYECKQLWQGAQPPIALFTYSEIESLVELSRNALKSKLWILVIVSEEGSYNTEGRSVNLTHVSCESNSKLTTKNIEQMETSAEYLLLTRWLIPRNTPINSISKLMCLMVYDDFTDVSLDYRDFRMRSSMEWNSFLIIVCASQNYLANIPMIGKPIYSDGCAFGKRT